MEYTLNRQGNDFLLEISGTFTFSDNSKFRSIATTLRESEAKAVTLGMRKLEFIDSAALGMLLLLHDEAQKKGFKVTLSGADGQIKKMLQLSNFDEIFTIEYV